MTNKIVPEQIDEMLAENLRRKRALHKPYNPVTGYNALGKRVTVELPDAPIPRQFVPQPMLDENPFAKSLAQAGCLDSFILAKLHKSPSFELKEGLWTKWLQLRIRYDFEFWAAMFVKIKDKKGQNDIPFILNRPQRRLLAMLEEMRLAGKPIRLIMLKARQWGGSTLVQMYMAWIQLVHRKNWNSIICAHLKDAAAQIKGMYTKLLDNYPAWLLGDGAQPTFKPFEKSSALMPLLSTIALGTVIREVIGLMFMPATNGLADVVAGENAIHVVSGRNPQSFPSLLSLGGSTDTRNIIIVAVTVVILLLLFFFA